MRAFAHQVMNPAHLRVAPAVVDHAVAKLIAAERPQDALVGFAEQGLRKKAEGFASFRHSLSVNPKRA